MECCVGWEGVSIERVQDLPERNTAEDEAPEGKRKLCGWGRLGEVQGERRAEDFQRIRGPPSPAWRPSQRGGRGRAAWLYSQLGDARSPSARPGPEPEQGKPTQRRREIKREGQTEKACKEAGHVQKKRDTLSTHTHTDTAEGFLWKNLYKHLHNKDTKAAISKGNDQAVSTCAQVSWVLWGEWWVGVLMCVQLCKGENSETLCKGTQSVKRLEMTQLRRLLGLTLWGKPQCGSTETSVVWHYSWRKTTEHTHTADMYCFRPPMHVCGGEGCVHSCFMSKIKHRNLNQPASLDFTVHAYNVLLVLE